MTPEDWMNDFIPALQEAEKSFKNKYIDKLYILERKKKNKMESDDFLRHQKKLIKWLESCGFNDAYDEEYEVNESNRKELFSLNNNKIERSMPGRLNIDKVNFFVINDLKYKKFINSKTQKIKKFLLTILKNFSNSKEYQFRPRQKPRIANTKLELDSLYQQDMKELTSILKSEKNLIYNKLDHFLYPFAPILIPNVIILFELELIKKKKEKLPEEFQHAEDFWNKLQELRKFNKILVLYSLISYKYIFVNFNSPLIKIPEPIFKKSIIEPKTHKYAKSNKYAYQTFDLYLTLDYISSQKNISYSKDEVPFESFLVLDEVKKNIQLNVETHISSELGRIIQKYPELVMFVLSESRLPIIFTDRSLITELNIKTEANISTKYFYNEVVYDKTGYKFEIPNFVLPVKKYIAADYLRNPERFYSDTIHCKYGTFKRNTCYILIYTKPHHKIEENKLANFSRGALVIDSDLISNKEYKEAIKQLVSTPEFIDIDNLKEFGLDIDKVTYMAQLAKNRNKIGFLKKHFFQINDILKYTSKPFVDQLIKNQFKFFVEIMLNKYKKKNSLSFFKISDLQSFFSNIPEKVINDGITFAQEQKLVENIDDNTFKL